MIDLAPYQQRGGGLITLAQLRERIVYQDNDYFVCNKPGWLVCHPSKNGPMSSLVGAVREYLGVDTVHPAARLDRETSGVTVLATNRKAAGLVQSAVERKQVRKRYLCLLEGALSEPAMVEAPLARDPHSAVAVKQCIDPQGKPSQSRFRPLIYKAGYTFCEAEPITGRMHQLRVHAASLGHPIVADKLYGADETLYLELCEKGWSQRHAALPLPRQALHCAEMDFSQTAVARTFKAPLEPDMLYFLEKQMGIEPTLLAELIGSDLVANDGGDQNDDQDDRT